MKDINSIFPERICPMCGKTFIPAPEHAYRDKWTHKAYCSWHCFNHRNDHKKGKPTKPIEQCTLDGVVIKTYPSATVAAIETYGYPNAIRKACKTNTTYKGYIWRYKNDLSSV